MGEINIACIWEIVPVRVMKGGWKLNTWVVCQLDAIIESGDSDKWARSTVSPQKYRPCIGPWLIDPVWR